MQKGRDSSGKAKVARPKEDRLEKGQPALIPVREHITPIKQNDGTAIRYDVASVPNESRMSASLKQIEIESQLKEAELDIIVPLSNNPQYERISSLSQHTCRSPREPVPTSNEKVVLSQPNKYVNVPLSLDTTESEGKALMRQPMQSQEKVPTDQHIIQSHETVLMNQHTMEPQGKFPIDQCIVESQEKVLIKQNTMESSEKVPASQEQKQTTSTLNIENNGSPSMNHTGSQGNSPSQHSMQSQEKVVKESRDKTESIHMVTHTSLSHPERFSNRSLQSATSEELGKSSSSNGVPRESTSYEGSVDEFYITPSRASPSGFFSIHPSKHGTENDEQEPDITAVMNEQMVSSGEAVTHGED